MTQVNDRISIVMCSKDRRETLDRAIDSIRRADDVGRTAEVVVVEETDAPRPIPGTRYVPLPRRDYGFGYARNVAIKEASGSLLLFIDDDCEAERGWAEALIAPFQQNPKILGVAGAVLVRNCGLLGYAENILGFPGGGLRYLHESRGQVVATSYLSTCNCAYRLEAIQQAGGFSEEARAGGEDALLAERVASLGFCVYAPRAVVYHRTRDNLTAIFRWFKRRGFSEMATVKKHVNQRAFLNYLFRSSWTIRMALFLALALAYPRVLVLLPSALAIYCGAILWRFRFARQYPKHRRAWWLVPLVKSTMDVGSEIGRWAACFAWKER